MANLNIENTRKALQSFDFKKLFVEELGWSNPLSSKDINETIKDVAYVRKPIAELSGAVVFEITTPSGEVPDPKQRQAIAKEIQKQHFEHVLIFVDKARTQSIWHWLKSQDKKMLSREHFFSRHQPGDGFIAKIASLVVDISEFDKEGKIAIAEVASRIKSALDIERVVKRFFRDYQAEYLVFLDLIQGIDNEADRRWYASVILNRLMFIYFLQKKMFLDNGDTDYLNRKLEFSKKELGKNKYYETFLNKLFFEGFAKQENQRDAETNKLIGKIKYLNGGLFLLHKIELKYPEKIKIPDVAFDNLFALFNRYSWTLDDTPGGDDNEMNPDVLGYIFEKYINQKAFGAYYTRTEITEYLCEQTIYKLILDEVNGPDITPELLRKAGLTPPKRYDTIAELLLNLDAATCRKLIVGDHAVLPSLSLLDPACGSGAFLVAAMKTLINVYAAILGKIEFLGDKKLTEWKRDIEQAHPSINYYIKKQIITHNLFGVDLMEEATEIAKLRLFLALVASAQTVEQLEPLPNIDFNIMSGNSLIGLTRVDESEFNQHQKGDMFKKSYSQLVTEKEMAIQSFKCFESTSELMQIKKKSIDDKKAEATQTLNLMLAQEFKILGIKYEQVTWDEIKNKEGKPTKQTVHVEDIQALKPFHWGYEFSEIFRKKNGFDAIITNPPWEIFKPNSKEFFLDYSKAVSKKKMTIKDFEKEQGKLLQDKEIRKEWTDYLSRFPHVSSYYRSATQYKNQISVVNGKKAGSDINLYKLFIEQCFNLLRKNGYCGIVIPGTFNTDLGAKQLRVLLFENTKITGIFLFDNAKKIFDIHSSIHFDILTFEKGGKTVLFPGAFMKKDFEDLKSFPKDNAINIPVEFVKKISPESCSINEVKKPIDFLIATKLLKWPLLNEEIENVFNLKLYREFDMTNDSHLFITEYELNRLKLFEGKMIHQFSSGFAENKYWIRVNDGRSSILGKEIDLNQILDYQRYRLAYRAVGQNTNERNFISTVIPKNVFCGNSLIVSKGRYGVSDLLFITATFNSFVLDYFLRQRISRNINMFYVYQLPVPRLKPKDKWYNAIVSRAARLICTTEEFAELWEEVMGNPWRVEKAATQEVERNQLRTELDGIIAHIYGLTEEEFAYILSTFPIVPQVQKIAAHNAYRDVERGMIKPS